MTVAQTHPSDGIETPKLPLVPLAEALTEEHHRCDDEGRRKQTREDPVDAALNADEATSPRPIRGSRSTDTG